MGSSTTRSPDPRPPPRKTSSGTSTQSGSSTSSGSPLTPSSLYSPTYFTSEPSEAAYITREPKAVDPIVLERPRPRSGFATEPPLTSPTAPWRPEHARSASDSSSRHPSSPTRPGHVKRKSRNSGTMTQCGRHSNEWLFGNVSVTETVKHWFAKDDGKQ